MQYIFQYSPRNATVYYKAHRRLVAVKNTHIEKSINYLHITEEI